MEVGLGLGDFVLDEDPAPPPQKGQSPQFLGYVCCGQTAVWIMMALALGTEVGLGPGRIMLDGDPPHFPLKREGTTPNFRPCLLWPNGWMDQDATWYGGRPRPRRIVLDGDPAPPP